MKGLKALKCTSLFVAVLSLALACSFLDEGPVDDKPHFELRYTIDGVGYHVIKNNNYAGLWLRTLSIKQTPIETHNACGSPYCSRDVDGSYLFDWNLDNPLDVTFCAKSDSTCFIIHQPYQIVPQYVRFAQGYAPSEYCSGQFLDVLDSLSSFTFERNDKNGIYISFELALEFDNDTIYVRDGYAEAHPNRSGHFVWDISKYIHDE